MIRFESIILSLTIHVVLGHGNLPHEERTLPCIGRNLVGRLKHYEQPYNEVFAEDLRREAS